MVRREFRTSRRIEFADTDMGGIVHFARFFVFMETAEHEFLRSLGHVVHAVGDGTAHGWPRRRAECEYLSPARFGDVLDIHLEVVRRGTTSLTYAVEFRHGERLVARGRVSAVHCRIAADGRLESVPIPASLAARIGAVAPADEAR